MPKEAFVIKRFDGGLVNDPDAKDLLENELSAADDIIVSKYGKIIMVGSGAYDETPTWSSILNNAYSITKGYGLFLFSADYDLSNNNVKTNILVYGGVESDDDNSVSIFESDGTAYSGNPIVLESVASNAPLYCFYIADGGLRITDGNFSNTPVNKWFGFISRTHFEGLTPGGSANTYLSWYVKDNTLPAPTRGLLITGADDIASGGDADTLIDTGRFAIYSSLDIDGKGYIAVNQTDNQDVEILNLTVGDESNSLDTDALTGGAVWSGDTYIIYPPAGEGFNLYTGVYPGVVGEFMATDYIFAQSFIYDGNQESKLYEMGGTLTVASDNSALFISIVCTSPFDPRISGGRIYFREADTVDSWKLLVDIDLSKGCRISLAHDFVPWSSETASVSPNPYVWWPSFDYIVDQIVASSINPDTYQSLTGFNPSENITVDQYKTAVVNNRITYIGNVKIEGEIHSDSVYKSYPNRFDMFSKNRKIDVAVNDGDDVVKIEVYSDRLLEFKEKRLYIINISQDIEFLEETKEFLGVTKPYHVCATEFGVAWINKYGVYLYNGEQVIDLFIKDGIRKFDIDVWNAFFSDDSAIAYNPIMKRIQILSDLDAATKNFMIFDFVSYSWTKAINRWAQVAGDASNMATDWDGYIIGTVLHPAAGSYLYRWSDTPASSTNLNIGTGNIDFGLPGVKKDVYKIYITYKANQNPTNVRIRFYTNGGSTAYDFTPVSNCITSGGFCVLSPSASGAVASMMPDTPSEANDIYSFKLTIDYVNISGSAPASFEINDITIIYRAKGIR
jgi:hypothetical protein